MNIEALKLEAAKRAILVKILSKEAFERLGRVRIANPNLANQIELYLIQLYQTGQLKEKITDEKLKQILALFVEKRHVKIKRK